MQQTASAKLKQPVESGQGSVSIGFRHGGIVEGGGGEVVDAVRIASLGHDGLSDMDNLGRRLAEAVDAEDLHGVAVKQNFEHPYGMAGDLCPGNTLEHGVTHLVGDLLLGQLSFGTPDGAYLGIGIDTVGEVLARLFGDFLF